MGNSSISTPQLNRYFCQPALANFPSGGSFVITQSLDLCVCPVPHHRFVEVGVKKRKDLFIKVGKLVKAYMNLCIRWYIDLYSGIHSELN
jgi:hypothetical protein